MKKVFSVDGIEDNSFNDIGNHIYDSLKPIFDDNRIVIFLCIGSDRCTGDSLGPLVGHHLKHIKSKKIHVYGSLEYPVHSQNLQETLDKIKDNFNDPYIIAIDASLGSFHNIGKIFIENTPLFPGLALDKNLPPVGDLSITGIVNVSGKFEFMVLQNTRLYTVNTIAENIAKGISYSINKLLCSDINLTQGFRS
ncbi:spore protease YyaC [Clostridium sp.]|uniref:spore protease YyaC n=1 Tax=Clostridium sp. TaxID=1506 RepID=UPI002FC840D5